MVAASDQAGARRRRTAPRRVATPVLAAAVLAAGALAGCDTPRSAPVPGGAVVTPAVSATGCTEGQLQSGGAAVLAGAVAPLPGGAGFVTAPAAWRRLDPATRSDLLAALGRAAAGAAPAACVRTAAVLRVRRRPPPSGVDLVSAAAVPPGCRPGASGTVRCSTTFGFGSGATPLSPTGQLDYRGTPLCVDYAGGQLCTGWFGAWGSDGAAQNGLTGAALGSAALGVVSAGEVRASLTAAPDALYTSHAPAGQTSAVTVGASVTLLDVTLAPGPAAGCAPTSVSVAVITPQQGETPVARGAPRGCVATAAFLARQDPGARASGIVAALRSARRLVAGPRALAALHDVVDAVFTAQRSLRAVPSGDLPPPGAQPGTAAVSGPACPVLNAALTPTAPDHTHDFGCSQWAMTPWQGQVAGQSLVSPQVTTAVGTSSGPGAGTLHVVLALVTVTVSECWPAAACGPG